jgi:hypothetical protein
MMKDPPSNSHLQFQYLISSAGAERFESQNWTHLGFYSYIVMQDSTQAEALEGKIQELNQRYIGILEDFHLWSLRWAAAFPVFP